MKNREKLDKWLERNEAHKLFEQLVRGQHRSLVLEFWSINGQLLIVMHQESGWDLFLPASDKNDVVATLDAAAERLNCLGCADL